MLNNMKLISVFALLFVFLVGSANAATPTDSIDAAALKSKATELQSKATELKPKATELKNLFEGYKAKAHGKDCNKAEKEASDGLDMAEEAVKDCESVEKLAAKVLKAKKPTELPKLVAQMEKKVSNAKYYIHQAEDRKKETEFELRGCH